MLSICMGCYANSNRILIVGDSLSAAYNMEIQQGWVNLLEKKLNTSFTGWQIINSSVSGETTAGGLQKLPQLLNKHNPKVVIIGLGGNDGLRGYPPIKIKSNLSQLIELSLKANSRVLLLKMQLPPNYGSVYTERFSNLYNELKAQYPLILVPFILDNIATDPKLMMPDGIHPTALAQPLILDNIWPHLKPLLE